MKHLLLIITLISFIGINHKAEAKRVQVEECDFFEFGCITIFEAAEEGDFESVKQYVAQGGNVDARNEDGETSLHFAAEKGHMQIVQFLISKKADPNIQGIYGYAPLHWAIREDHTEIAEFLILEGVDVNAQTYTGWSPLHFAANRNQMEIVELLVEKGADVNIRTYNKGRTPLSLVPASIVLGARNQIKKFLISKGATY